MSNLNKYRIWLGLLLLPLFFINVKTTHDWGDDFAQYLIQTKNIADHKPHTENGLLQNEEAPVYAIQAYPVGLPLLLVPVYLLTGLNIFPFCLFFSFVLFIAGIVSFEFFRKKTTSLFSLFITLIFCYNIQLLILKKQILSEIPFTLFLLLFLAYNDSIKSNKKYYIILNSLLLAYLLSLRLIGIAAVAGFVPFILMDKNRFNTSSFKRFTVIIFTLSGVFLIFVLLNEYIFPIGTFNLAGFYVNALQTHKFYILNNVKNYYSVSNFIFPFFGFLIPSVWILAALAGWIIKCIQSISLAEYIFFFYMILILIYPYGDGGARFLIPILPLLIFYTGYFLKFILNPLGNRTNIILTGLYISMVLACIHPALKIISEQSKTEDGPQRESSIELFDFAKQLPAQSIFVFCRARAFHLYTDRQVLYTTREESVEETFKRFQKLNAVYMIIPKNNQTTSLRDERLEALIKKYNNFYRRIWENQTFEIFKQE